MSIENQNKSKTEMKTITAGSPTGILSFHRQSGLTQEGVAALYPYLRTDIIRATKVSHSSEE